jgi:hypothetical protein
VASANAGAVSVLLHAVDLGAMSPPADESLAEALAPLQIRLDLVIDMLGRLSYGDIALPPVREIDLGTDRIGWHSPSCLSAGDWLRIRLYFDAKIREPVVLYAHVESAIGDAAGGGWGVQAQLAEISPQTEEAFTRLAFLAQRRQLAERAGAAVRGER